jgi:hypothetical protein
MDHAWRSVDDQLGLCLTTELSLSSVSTHWRHAGSGDQDSRSGWSEVYDSVDAISPWTVRRYTDDTTADRYIADYARKDMMYLKDRRIQYVPTVFPGFSVRR